MNREQRVSAHCDAYIGMSQRDKGQCVTLFDTDRLNDASLDISKIVCHCSFWESRRYHRRGGLVSFAGVYTQYTEQTVYRLIPFVW
jgi:hypothetical protein